MIFGNTLTPIAIENKPHATDKIIITVSERTLLDDDDLSLFVIGGVPAPVEDDASGDELVLLCNPPAVLDIDGIAVDVDGIAVDDDAMAVDDDDGGAFVDGAPVDEDEGGLAALSRSHSSRCTFVIRLHSAPLLDVAGRSIIVEGSQ